MAFINNISPKEALESLKKRKDHISEIHGMVLEIYKSHKRFLPFNWLYIIENSIDHISIELNATNSLIKRISKLKDWKSLSAKKEHKAHDNCHSCYEHEVLSNKMKKIKKI